ncbi:hypothetical protein LBMAG56_08430 [Verrucomicrobiota bacterium]|nr:hypothetical protein LBMAG56_08430 [Verrucomicrobiota bacterium]
MADSKRPTRLSTPTLAVLGALLGGSLVSGLLVWYGVNANRHLDDMALESAAAFPVRFWITIHGLLNPLLCFAFGWLSCEHVPGGWKMQANRASGAVVVAALGLLILSGAGLYYAGDPRLIDLCRWTHRIVGVGLPVLLAGHWIAALRWVKSL